MTIIIPDTVIDSDVKRLTNQMWKLLPMRENGEHWQDHLDSLIVEVAGLGKIANMKESFIILLSKLEGLRETDTTFLTYRKTVFECISLLGELRL